MRILHIHQDYPDGSGASKTQAVKNLLDATASEHDHFVLSINRTSNPSKVSSRRFADGLSVTYWALPLPLVYAPSITLATQMVRRMLRSEEPFDLVHGHKLTTEGLWAQEIARAWGLPYLLSLRGGSDLKNLRRLRLTSRFAKVAAGARRIFLVSPWAMPKVQQLLGAGALPTTTLPNICLLPPPPARLERGTRRFCCVADLRYLKRKGLPETIAAICLLRGRGVEICLDIYGGGAAEDVAEVRRLISRFGLDQHVQICGKLEHEDLLQRLSLYCGFVLASTNETFGMAYVEALWAGLPIIYMRRTGIDGLVPEDVGIGLDTRSAQTIAEAMHSIYSNQEIYCNAIMKFSHAGGIEQFSAAAVGKTYCDALEAIEDFR